MFQENVWTGPFNAALIWCFSLFLLSMCKMMILERKCTDRAAKLCTALERQLSGGVSSSDVWNRTVSFFTVKKALIFPNGYNKSSREAMRLFPSPAEDVAPLCWQEMRPMGVHHVKEWITFSRGLKDCKLKRFNDSSSVFDTEKVEMMDASYHWSWSDWSTCWLSISDRWSWSPEDHANSVLWHKKPYSFV